MPGTDSRVTSSTPERAVATATPSCGHGTILHVGYSHTLSCIARDLLLGLRQDGWSIEVACHDDEWTPALREHGFRVWPIRFPHRPTPAQALVGARDLLATLRDGSFTAVHTHNAHHGVVGRHLGRAKGLPAFHTWRYDPLDASDSRPRQLLYGLAEGSASRLTEAVMFQNPEDLELAVQRRIVPPAKSFLVGNGIVTERYEQPARERDAVRAELGVPADAEVVLCVARLAERKGQPDLLRALGPLAGSRPRLRVLLVGTGPDEGDLRGLARSLGIEARVHFVGQRGDVPDLLHASDVLCLPSRREGIPRAVMEAMAARLPVVATNVVGTRSLIEDGRSGLLVDYGDARALGAALERVLDDEELRRALTAAAAEDVAREWHQQVVVERVGRLYGNFLRR